MRPVREILRLRSLSRTVREIAEGLGISPSTVGDYLIRAKAAKLGWPLPAEMDDAALEKPLFSPREEQRPERPLPDWSQVHAEFQKKHVTLAILWEEYKTDHPDGYQYSQFCELYRSWARTLQLWMRQEHRPGEKLFVDYAGDGIPWVNPITGEEHTAWLFVGALGTSSLNFARATATQQLEDWIDCHVKAVEFFGGAPHVFVPDQCRTAIKQTCRYDPVANPTYHDLAAHYGACII